MTENPNILIAGEKPQVTAQVRAPDPYQAVYDAGAQYSLQENEAIRARQKSRALITGALLFGLCVMFFGITLAKIGYWG
jgi:hypothetical protein